MVILMTLLVQILNQYDVGHARQYHLLMNMWLNLYVVMIQKMGILRMALLHQTKPYNRAIGHLLAGKDIKVEIRDELTMGYKQVTHDQRVDPAAIKPCPFCGEGVMGDEYPCWKYTIVHKEKCYMRNFGGKSFIHPEKRNNWNKRAL